MKLNVFNVGENKRYAPHLLGKDFAVTSRDVDLTTGELRPAKGHSLVSNLNLNASSIRVSDELVGQDIQDGILTTDRDEVNTAVSIGRAAYYINDNGQLVLQNNAGVDAIREVDLEPPSNITETTQYFSGFPIVDVQASDVNITVNPFSHPDLLPYFPVNTRVLIIYNKHDEDTESLVFDSEISSLGSGTRVDVVLDVASFNGSKMYYFYIEDYFDRGNFYYIGRYNYNNNFLKSFAYTNDFKLVEIDTSSGNTVLTPLPLDNEITSGKFNKTKDVTVYITRKVVFSNGVEVETRPAIFERTIKAGEQIVYDSPAPFNTYILGLGVIRPTLYKEDFSFSVVNSVTEVNPYRRELPSINNYALEASRHQGTNLVYHKGRLYYSKGAELWYSNFSELYLFPKTNVMLMSQDIISLKSLGERLLIMFKDGFSILYGDDISNFYLKNINPSVGSILKNVEFYENNLYFLSDDGVYAFDGYRSKNLTLDLFPLDFDFTQATDICLFENKLFISFPDRFYTLDLKNKLKLNEYSSNGQVVKFKVLKGKIYGLEPTTNGNYNVRELFTGDLVPYYYKTADFTEGGLTILKQYKDFYVAHEGDDVEMKVNVDDESFTFNLQGQEKTKNIRIPQKLRRGYKINFEFRGLGVIKELTFRSLLRKVDLG